MVLNCCKYLHVLLFVDFSSSLTIKVTNFPLPPLHYKALYPCLHGVCYLGGNSLFSYFFPTHISRSEMKEIFPNAYVLAPRVKRKGIAFVVTV